MRLYDLTDDGGETVFRRHALGNEVIPKPMQSPTKPNAKAEAAYSIFAL